MDEIREVKLWRSIAHGQFCNLSVFRLFNYKDIQGGQKLEKVPFLSHQSIVPLPYNQGACHRSKFGPPPLINRTLCSEASYPLLKTAREDCANGDMPATVSPT